MVGKVGVGNTLHGGQEEIVVGDERVAEREETICCEVETGGGFDGADEAEVADGICV